MESSGYWERQREREPEEGRCLKELLLHVQLPIIPLFYENVTPASRLAVIIHHGPPLLLLSDLKTGKTSDVCMQKTWRWRQMEGRKVKRERSWRALSPIESREHGEQTGPWRVLHALWSACSWWFDAVPSGPAPNICLSELQVLGSGIHGDWQRENCDSCPVYCWPIQDLWRVDQ